MSLKKQEWKTYLFWILFTQAVGAISGWLTRESTRLYAESVVKPPLSPPAILFPIVWVILFTLMGIGAACVDLSSASHERTRALQVYLVQLGFNFFWSIIFFNLQKFGIALLWLFILWLLIVWMILSFCKVDRKAARLQIPYLLWVTFAIYLNFGIWILN